MNFHFKPLTESDLPLLADWLNRPHLQQWWRSGEISVESVRKKYLPRIVGIDDARPYIACLENIPVGYIQHYDASAGAPNWWPDQPGPGVLGIDMFLGDENKLNNGMGTAMATQFISFLFEDPSVTEIRIDPQPDNLRALHCYEKVGFQRMDEISNPDGPAVMMILTRQAFSDNHLQ